MPHLIIDCDEKWPIYDLQVPEGGQEANCEVSEEFYREYLYIMIKYEKFQIKLKEYYDFDKQGIRECTPESFREGCIVEPHAFNQITYSSKQ